MNTTFSKWVALAVGAAAILTTPGIATAQPKQSSKSKTAQKTAGTPFVKGGDGHLYIIKSTASLQGKWRLVMRGKRKTWQPVGLIKRFHRNGKTRSLTWYSSPGVKNAQTTFHSNGVHSRNSVYRNSKLHGTTELYDRRGKKYRAYEYRNGKKHGRAHAFSWSKKHGYQKTEMATFRNGKKHGTHYKYRWSRIGMKRVSSSVSYKNGKKDGWATAFRSDGSTRETRYYSNGKLISKERPPKPKVTSITPRRRTR